MYHFVARAAPGALLWRTWEEGLALWSRLVAAFPEAVAAALMPDHVHLVLPHADPAGRLRDVMSAYARWRNAARRERGPVWAPHPAPEAIPDAQHLRRTVRYLHLNPCRARLVADPLAWPFSTHRDRVGYAFPATVAAEPDPARFHRYVSADDTVDTAGTSLPQVTYGDVRWEDVRDAVTSVCRVLPEGVLVRGPVRGLALKTAWAHGQHDAALLAAAAGCTRNRVYDVVAGVPGRAARFADPALQACVRAVGDPRFAPLYAGDLRGTRAWARYRGRR